MSFARASSKPRGRIGQRNTTPSPSTTSSSLGRARPSNGSTNANANANSSSPPVRYTSPQAYKRSPSSSLSSNGANNSNNNNDLQHRRSRSTPQQAHSPAGLMRINALETMVKSHSASAEKTRREHAAYVNQKEREIMQLKEEFKAKLASIQERHAGDVLVRREKYAALEADFERYKKSNPHVPRSQQLAAQLDQADGSYHCLACAAAEEDGDFSHSPSTHLYHHHHHHHGGPNSSQEDLGHNLDLDNKVVEKVNRNLSFRPSSISVSSPASSSSFSYSSKLSSPRTTGDLNSPSRIPVFSPGGTLNSQKKRNNDDKKTSQQQQQQQQRENVVNDTTSTTDADDQAARLSSPEQNNQQPQQQTTTMLNSPEITRELVNIRKEVRSLNTNISRSSDNKTRASRSSSSSTSSTLLEPTTDTSAGNTVIAVFLICVLIAVIGVLIVQNGFCTVVENARYEWRGMSCVDGLANYVHSIIREGRNLGIVQ